MLKRFISVLVIVCFTVFVATSSISLAETQAEKDQRQARAVNAAIGLVALVGVIFMVSKMTSSAKLDDDKHKVYFASLKKPEEKERINIGLDFFESGFIQGNSDNHSVSNADEWRSPELKLGYKW